jgi:hypothetical protein
MKGLQTLADDIQLVSDDDTMLFVGAEELQNRPLVPDMTELNLVGLVMKKTVWIQMDFQTALMPKSVMAK